MAVGRRSKGFLVSLHLPILRQYRSEHYSSTNQSSNFESNYITLYVYVNSSTLYDLPPNTKHGTLDKNERKKS